ncbi:MAG: NUDIX hydrolase [Patescibacteria group bacterium]
MKQYVAAKAIITNSDNKVLVLRQSFEKEVDGAGQYHVPGGIVEPGESLREALIREVHEETQFDIKPLKVLSVEEWQANMRGDDCYFFGMFFACELVGGDLEIQAEEASGFAWVDLENIDSYDILQPSKKIIEDYLKSAQ